MKIKDSYKDREHSFIKHELLSRYLEKLLYIIGCGGVREIVYIDCFAGPWGDNSDDHAETSISISLNIIDKVKKSLASRHAIDFKVLYIEKTKKRHKELCKMLEAKCPNDIPYKALHGDYSELTSEILDYCGNTVWCLRTPITILPTDIEIARRDKPVS